MVNQNYLEPLQTSQKLRQGVNLLCFITAYQKIYCKNAEANVVAEKQGFWATYFTNPQLTLNVFPGRMGFEATYCANPQLTLNVVPDRMGFEPRIAPIRG